MTAFPYVADGDGVRLLTRVTPLAWQSAAEGIVASADGRSALSIRLAAPPVGGAADRAPVRFLAQRMRVPVSRIRPPRRRQGAAEDGADRRNPEPRRPPPPAALAP